MNPFPDMWPSVAMHHRTECSALTNYFRLSNEPEVPVEGDVEGHIIVIAGKAHTGGKSVFSHRLLHELCKNGRVPIDLMETMESNYAKNGDGNPCFSGIVDRADLEDLFKESGADTRILNRSDWGTRNHQLARELDGNRLVIRMPRLDSTLKTEDVADDIKRYATSARILRHSIYIYEYSYVKHAEWQALQNSLNEISGSLKLVETHLLLVGDVMNFINRRLEEHHKTRSALDWVGTEAFFDERASANGGLEESLGDLSNVMHRAFAESESRHEPQVPSWRVTHEYYKARAIRELRRAPAGAP